ncbi:unnamed protein product [Larinioides sclopetarius]|uniref:Exonuclease domain-containing protein n=1 Tax=Larinioides sclopetarius TaxID=280406 RepID=A0AAV2A8K0_9ARAC
MISMIWISQTALRFADTELFATILFSLILMWILLSFKGDEEGGVTGLFQYLIAGFLYFCTSAKFWNKNSQPQDERKPVNPKKENKKAKGQRFPVVCVRNRRCLNCSSTDSNVPSGCNRNDQEGGSDGYTEKVTENPPPVVENPKRKQKKGKKSQKKSHCKENTEPPMTKRETRMFSSWDICGQLNRDPKSIYDELYKHILTDVQLRMNHFPHEGFKPWTEVPVDDSNRQCVRCGVKFTIFNGLHLSDCKCHYHPRKATFVAGTRVHGCCNAPRGSPPCAISNTHVTVQHRPRPLTKTSSRRHVKKDLQHTVFSLDCEMCYTTEGLEVVRVGLVNMEGLAVYDGFVKPKGKILDYNTLYSGVDQSHLHNVTVTVDDVKQILSSLIHEDTILVGHALNNDLAALGLIHGTIVDTSVLFADPRIPSKKTALKTLASDYLGLKIQDSQSGHDCIDDARATLQLALLKVPVYVPEPFPEQAPHQPAAKQATTSGLSSRQEQQPLMEIQNLGHFQPGVYWQDENMLKSYGNCEWLSHVSHSPWLRGGY